MNDTIEALRKESSLTKRLLEVHLAKPHKVDLFFRALQNFTKTGTLKYSLSFSFWGLLGNFWFYLYRKMYAQAAVFFLLPIVTSILGGIFYFIIALTSDYYIPYEISMTVLLLSSVLSIIISIILLLLPGFAGIYLYIKKFLKDLEIAGFKTREDNEGFETNLSLLGGYNTWALVVPIVVSIIGLLVFIFMIAAMALFMDSIRYY